MIICATIALAISSAAGLWAPASIGQAVDVLATSGLVSLLTTLNTFLFIYVLSFWFVIGSLLLELKVMHFFVHFRKIFQEQLVFCLLFFVLDRFSLSFDTHCLRLQVCCLSRFFFTIRNLIMRQSMNANTCLCLCIYVYENDSVFLFKFDLNIKFRFERKREYECV
jgi:hypothetical protein